MLVYIDWVGLMIGQSEALINNELMSGWDREKEASASATFDKIGLVK